MLNQDKKNSTHNKLTTRSGGFNPLQFSARASNWPLVELLLKFGADPSIEPQRKKGSKKWSQKELCSTKKDKKKYQEILKRIPVSARGLSPRMCPCNSGETYQACHEKGKLLEDSWLCPCGSDVRFGDCCKKIRIVYVRAGTPLRIGRTEIRDTQEVEALQKMQEMMRGRPQPDFTRPSKFAEMLWEPYKQLVDRAFYYAMRKAKKDGSPFSPVRFANLSPQREDEKVIMMVWLVIEYVGHGIYAL